MRVACELRRVPRVMLQTQALGRSSPGVADDESVRLRAHMWHSGRGACSMQPIWASISLNHIFALATALGAAGPDLTMSTCGGLHGALARPRVYPHRESGAHARSLVPLPTV